MSLIPQRWPLATQVVVRLLLNLLIVGGAFGGVMALQGRINPGWLLAGRAGERLQTVAALVAGDLSTAKDEETPEIIERYHEAYHLDFLVFDPGGRLLTPTTIQIPGVLLGELTRPRRGMGDGGPQRINAEPGPGNAGPTAEVPREPVQPPSEFERESTRDPERDRERMRERPLRRRLGPNAAGEAEGRLRRAGQPGPGLPRLNPIPRAVLRAGTPPAYWIVLPLPPQRNGPNRILVVRAESLWSGGLLLDPRPWILAGLAAIALSVVFWIPFVRAITGDIARMTRTTAEIAAGKFDTRLDLVRRDELGRLASSIDGMATRLANHVAGQKRFLGDAAHELCTPIARMQAAVALLETRTDPTGLPYLDDLREELDEMAGLVGELLAFSRATHGRAAKLESVDLHAVANRAWHRESDDSVSLSNEIPPGLQVTADTALLQRALANLFRNAIRYAGRDGPIRISATPAGDRIEIAVADQGPGVPPETLPRLFEPFYRPEASRARELGGAGLGLAIVKTCLDACGGTVEARNRQPRGFEVLLRLPPAA